MAISTQGTVLKVYNGAEVAVEVAIKSFPDLGAAPTAIDVTTLKDEVQRFIPGVKTLSAMEFVANYDKAAFEQLKSKLSSEGLFDPAHKKPQTMASMAAVSFPGTHQLRASRCLGENPL